MISEPSATPPATRHFIHTEPNRLSELESPSPKPFSQLAVTVTVDPTAESIEVTPPDARILYREPDSELESESEYGSEPMKPREVLWIAHGLPNGQRLVIRPKGGQSKSVFFAQEEGRVELTAAANSVASGLPNDPDLQLDPEIGKRTHVWLYVVEVYRDTGESPAEDDLLFGIDPCVVIEEEMPTSGR